MNEKNQEDLEKKLNDAIGYLANNGEIKLEHLLSLLNKRFKNFTIDDIQAKFPEIKIIGIEKTKGSNVDSLRDSKISQNEATLPNTSKDSEVSKLVQLAKIQLQNKKIKKMNELLERIENLDPFHSELAALRESWNTVNESASLLLREIRQMESLGKYYTSLELVIRLKDIYSDHPEIEKHRTVAENEIRRAENILENAKSVQQQDEKVKHYLKALEICKDCKPALDQLLTPPEAPVGLEVICKANHTFLKWRASNTSQGVTYRIIKKEGFAPKSITDGQVLIETTKTQFEDTDCQIGHTYSYAVYSVRGNISSVDSANHPPVLLIADISNLKVTESNREISFTWDSPANSIGTEIWRAYNSPPNKREVGDNLGVIKTNEYTDDTVSNEVPLGYLFISIFLDVFGEKKYSKGVVINAQAIAPPQAIEHFSGSILNGMIDLSWTPPPKGEVRIMQVAKVGLFKNGSLIHLDDLENQGQWIGINEGRHAIFKPDFIGRRYFIPCTIIGSTVAIGRTIPITYLQPVSNIEASIRGGKLYLEWEWPKNANYAKVSFNNGIFPSEAIDQTYNISKIIHRKDYEYKQAFILNDPENKSYYFSINIVEPLSDGDYLTSEGVDYLLDNSEEVVIQYQIKIAKSIFGKIKSGQIILKSEQFQNVPDLDLIHKKGGIPLRKNAGQLLVSIGKYEFNDAELTIDLPKEYLGKDRYARLFFKDETSQNVKLIAPPKKKLQLF